MKKQRVSGSPRLLLATLAVAAPLVAGCRITEDDVHRWGGRSSGPAKLVAVLQHDKYSRPLRIESALTLITMKPRGGQPVGLQGGEETKGLLTALLELSPNERTPIVIGLIEPLERGMARGMKDGGDESIPFKDAAYALLTEDEKLVEDPAARKRLRAALVTWTKTDFERRMDDTSQLYSVEQLLRLLGDEGMAGLSHQLKPGFKKMRELSKLVSELGSDSTRRDVSRRLVSVAEFVASEKWTGEKRTGVIKANEAAGHKVSAAQLNQQLSAYQEEELLRVFGAMKFVGQAPIVTYLIAFARDGGHSEKSRTAALAALEGNLEKKNQGQAQAMLTFLTDDKSPDGLRDVAARRIGELPREEVAEGLFRLFAHDRWQIRWTAASLVLRLSQKDQVQEFMDQLGRVRRMSLTEALTYGPLLQEISREEGRALALRFAQKDSPASVRVSALGYFYRHGTQKDVSVLLPFLDDRMAVPQCPRDPEGEGDAPGCAWTCTVTEGGSPVAKEVKTVGEFVDSCLIFAMKTRKDEETAKPASGAPPSSPATQEKQAVPTGAAAPNQAMPSPEKRR